MTLPYAESIFVGNTNSRVVLSIRKRTFCSTRASENTFLLMTGPKSSSHLANICFCQLHRQLISVHSKARLQYFEVADTAFFLGVEQCWRTIMEESYIIKICNICSPECKKSVYVHLSVKRKKEAQIDLI
jgi:hypothetical protein